MAYDLTMNWRQKFLISFVQRREEINPRDYMHTKGFTKEISAIPYLKWRIKLQ